LCGNDFQQRENISVVLTTITKCKFWNLTKCFHEALITKWNSPNTGKQHTAYIRLKLEGETTLTKVGFHCIWKYSTNRNNADTFYFCMTNYSNHQCKWCCRSIIIITIRVSNKIWVQKNISKDDYQSCSPNKSEISM